jgi:similar to stage IV sporulation protein
MAWRLLFYLLGYLEVEARGPSPEAFVNLAIQRGIYFWGLGRRDGRLRLRMGLQAFRRIRPVARLTGTRLHVVGRRGLPFLARRAARRPALMAGAGAAAVAVWVLGSFVWVVDVRVQGHGRVQRWEVLAAAERLGLRPGIRKGDLDLERIATELPVLLPRVAWAAVRLQGIKATVDVVERRLPEPGEEPFGPGDVVASKDGVVTRVLVLMGQPAVRPGQAVRAGQVLISGTFVPPTAPGAPGRGAAPLRVGAKGSVFALVWYDTYVEVPLHQLVVVPTGRVFVRRRLVAFGRRLDLGGWRPVPFPDYTLERSSAGFAFRSTPLPFELETLRYSEVHRFIRNLADRQAEQEAEASGRAALMRRIPPEARIVRSEADVVQRTAGRLGVRVRIEAEEDIGVWRPLPATP